MFCTCLQLVVSTTEVPPDAALKIWDQQIIPRLFELLHSTNSADRLGGLAVIDRVIELEQEDDGNDARRSKLYRIYNYVQSLLPCNDINHMIAASKTLGHIIEIGGPRLFGENFLNFEVMKVLALLEPDRDANSRYAGVLNLRALSKYSATHFYPYVPVVLDKIWAVLQDSRVG
jgi:FKBP12-rapamycin complex-associated protein